MKNEESATTSVGEFKRRFVKDFLDVLILQQVEAEPVWGYEIIKKTEMIYNVKLRHGALYPMLNELETKGFVKSRRELQKGRARKIYEITNDGKQFLQAWYDFFKEQLLGNAQK
jgi:PadR family transcriptional regulator PadR